MHPTAMDNALRFKKTYIQDASNLSIIEIGSQNVNGSIRDHFPEAKQYVGVDFCQADGVDLILDDPYQIPLENESTDIVLCSSVFEHSEFFWLLFLEIIRVLRPGGLFYLNAPSNGTFHRYPVDCWRFYPDAGNALKRWAERNSYYVDILECYTSNQDRDCWNDYVCVFHKKSGIGTTSSLTTNRILDNFNEFQNGRTDKSEAPLNESRLTQDQIIIRDEKAKLIESKKQLLPKSSRFAFHPLPGIFRAHLDSPTEVGCGSHKIKGWAIGTHQHTKPRLFLREDGIARSLPLNVKRPDVVSKILNEITENSDQLLCGFEYESTTISSIEIGIELNGNISWFKPPHSNQEKSK